MECREKSEFKPRCLRWIRVLIAVVSLAAMTALFVFPFRRVVSCFGWLPEIQLVSAIATGAVMTLVVLLVLTIVFGRVYCSVVCPLGIAQDWFRYIFTLDFIQKQHRSRVNRIPDKILWTIRLGFLTAFVIMVLCGLTAVLEPYGIFGRIATFAREFVGWLAQCPGIVGRAGRFALRHHIGGDMMLPVRISVVIILYGVIIFGATIFRSRWWCNTVCPVGTVLGVISRWSVFRVRIDSDKCVGCGACSASCSKGAITHGKTVRVDNSRCVVCMNCIGSCKKGALKWH